MFLKSLQGEEENGAAAPICESESDEDDCGGDNDGARLAVISRNKKRSFYTIIVPSGSSLSMMEAFTTQEDMGFYVIEVT